MGEWVIAVGHWAIGRLADFNWVIGVIGVTVVVDR
jgi:hypothetical protein